MRRMFFLIVLVLTVLLSVGCNEVEESVDLEEPIEFDYELIEEGDLINNAAKEWYQENKADYGSYDYVVNEKEKYLLVSAGERNTGGFALEVKDAYVSNQVITFDISLNKPSSDDMVTQALTYPSLLIRITATENFDVEANLNFELKKSNEIEEEKFRFESVEGIYVGQIDNNFIEVDLSKNSEFRERANIEEDFMSLMVPEGSKKDIEILDSGNPIVFTCYKDENHTWIIENIKINEDI